MPSNSRSPRRVGNTLTQVLSTRPLTGDEAVKMASSCDEAIISIDIAEFKITSVEIHVIKALTLTISLGGQTHRVSSSKIDIDPRGGAKFTFHKSFMFKITDSPDKCDAVITMSYNDSGVLGQIRNDVVTLAEDCSRIGVMMVTNTAGKIVGELRGRISISIEDYLDDSASEDDEQAPATPSPICLPKLSRGQTSSTKKLNSSTKITPINRSENKDIFSPLISDETNTAMKATPSTTTAAGAINIPNENTQSNLLFSFQCEENDTHETPKTGTASISATTSLLTTTTTPSSTTRKLTLSKLNVTNDNEFSNDTNNDAMTPVPQEHCVHDFEVQDRHELHQSLHYESSPMPSNVISTPLNSSNFISTKSENITNVTKEYEISPMTPTMKVCASFTPSTSSWRGVRSIISIIIAIIVSISVIWISKNEIENSMKNNNIQFWISNDIQSTMEHWKHSMITSTYYQNYNDLFSKFSSNRIIDEWNSLKSQMTNNNNNNDNNINERSEATSRTSNDHDVQEATENQSNNNNNLKNSMKNKKWTNIFEKNGKPNNNNNEEFEEMESDSNNGGAGVRGSGNPNPSPNPNTVSSLIPKTSINNNVNNASSVLLDSTSQTLGIHALGAHVHLVLDSSMGGVRATNTSNDKCLIRNRKGLKLSESFELGPCDEINSEWILYPSERCQGSMEIRHAIRKDLCLSAVNNWWWLGLGQSKGSSNPSKAGLGLSMKLTLENCKKSQRRHVYWFYDNNDHSWSLRVHGNQPHETDAMNTKMLKLNYDSIKNKVNLVVNGSGHSQWKLMAHVLQKDVDFHGKNTYTIKPHKFDSVKLL